MTKEKKKDEITWTGYRCKSCGGSGSKPGSLPFVGCAFCHGSNIEKLDSSAKKCKARNSIEIEEMYKNKKYFKLVEKDVCELEGPYECPCCRGHIMLDATFLEQVSTVLDCPYCSNTIYVKDVD